MQIVIDIPKDKYKEITSENAVYYPDDGGEVWQAVRYGTVLPEKHGRLIDADDIALIDEQFYTPSDYYVAENAINDAPTIIEATED